MVKTTNCPLNWIEANECVSFQKIYHCFYELHWLLQEKMFQWIKAKGAGDIVQVILFLA